MADLTIKGVLIKKLPTEKLTSKSSGKEYSKTEFMIETEDKYAKYVALTDMGFGKVSEIAIGSEIVVEFTPDSREYNGKFYTTLKSGKITVIKAAIEKPEPKVEDTKVETQADDSDQFVSERVDDDGSGLPF
jgi:hypothetical protein